MGRKHRSVPKEAGESGEIRKLKDANRRLKSDKAKLISELKTLKEAFDETRDFIDHKMEGEEVGKVIRAIKDKKKLKQIKEDTDESESCSRCMRPLKVIFRSMVRVIYGCPQCSVKKVVYTNEEGEYGEEEV